MNNRVTVHYPNTFRRGFAVCVLIFVGLGEVRENMIVENELSDAATAMDWLQAQNPASRQYWIADFSFGAWVGMQLMMEARNPWICRGYTANNYA